MDAKRFAHMLRDLCELTQQQIAWVNRHLASIQGMPELAHLVPMVGSCRNRGLTSGSSLHSLWERTTLDEDRSQIRTGHGPQMMACLRNLAMSLLRLAGCQDIAPANRELAAKPWQALRLLGV
ncbi:MAG: hypothetical protein HQL85_18880 [Magnetococcales bacterium]|nr:hypothetical protein [Magnetococcales bacterium]